MSNMVDMKTLTVNGTRFEVVDANNREQMEIILNKIEELSAKKDFVSVEFDNDTRYLHFLNENGEDVYDPILIEGGGSTSVVSSVVKLINQNGTSTITVASGSKVELSFNFTSTENDIPTGNGTCQISVNGNVKSTFDVEQGNITTDITKFLAAGTNTVRVKCTDIYGNYRMLVYTVSVVDIYVTSIFDSTITYSGDITFKYTPYGAIEKTIHVVVDEHELTANTTTTSGKQITQVIPAMPHGVHTIDVYITATLEDVPLESDHLTYAVMCVEENNTTPMIASAYNVETITQGEQVSIPYIVYDPSKLACDITLSIYTMSNGSEIVYSSQNIAVDRSQQFWNTRKYPVGTVYFRITYGDINKVHTITVEESKIDVDAETNDLELYLTSEGRSNNEPNPAVWAYGDVSTTFENVNWDTTGWVNDENGDTCLRLNGEAKAEISFKPFSDDIRTYGKTIELEFAIRDVNNRNATLMSCMSGNIGFEVTADTARIVSEQSNVFCKYKDEEKIRLAFVVESRSEHRALSVYLNGVLSDVIQYPDNDNFQQKTPVNITIGSEDCGVDIYTIRSYTTALSAPNAVTNFIADMDDIANKTVTYENNDIYDEYGNISFEKCKKKNSVMVIVGTLPASKGDKKTNKVEYYDIDDPSINFTDENVENDVQGTSSQYYVRKNFKMKFSSNRYIDKEHLPASVICIKVDYAEATGTHNTQNANFVETLYDETIPPQENDPKCRTTIYGKPILLFHKETENSEPVFYGKANYNYDKGAEHVFGFTNDYDVECWEFCNNTSPACNFTGTIPNDWSTDFEARYPDKYKNISRFKEMHDWVVSTNQNGATNEALSTAYTDCDGNTHTNDTAEYRLAKFKTEFENHFDMHYSLIYYVYTFFALMVDQRAKNMFLTYWASTGKWYPYFYDNDTSFGINNEGQLVFDYYHEDTDTLDNANVYNGQNSTLWVNFREAFPDEIKETYQDLRNNDRISYDKLVDRFITNGSDKWSESIYNEDSDFKYISMLRSDNDASNLPQVRGSGEEHFRYFIENRLNYCDSKWYASDYANDYVSLRIYTPTTWAGVEPKADITLTPYSNMYAGVRYKANGTLYQERVDHGVPVTFSPQGESFESENNETFNDTETAVYGASQISSLGDLAPLYCGSVNVSKANKLVELKVGDATEGYSNTNLKELSVGTNKLLKKIDVRNCPNFASVLDLSNCPAIEEVYTERTAITGVNFPESGTLKIAHLPATLANFTLKNQIYVEELTIAGYDAIKTLWVEGCPNVDGFDILSKSPNVERLRITDVDITYNSASEMLALAARPIGGIDENGTNIDKMWIDGKCHIKSLTGAEYLEVKAAFPYLTITYDNLVSYLTFMSEDGTSQLARVAVNNGGDATYSGSTPTKSSTAQYTYTFAGWSLTPGGSANSNALKNVEADRTVYAAFTSTLRKYTVRFYNYDGTLLQTVSNVAYGGTATYTGSTPTNNSTGNTADFQFYGWSPSPSNIQGDTNCYAQYNDLREITDSWATIKSNVNSGVALTKYGVGAFKTLEIGTKDLPYEFYAGSTVVYNNEIHILGGYDNRTKHYKWNGAEWTSVSTLPYSFSYSSAVIYNNEIHILGTSMSGYRNKHYKWDGSSWTSVSILPYDFNYGAVCVYDDEMHILGGYDNNTKHYKWNGTEWVLVSTLPYQFLRSSCAVVYKEELHILGGFASSGYKHYKWNGAEWTSVSTLPYVCYYNAVVVYNNEIHILGADDSSNDYRKHYKWDGSSWTSVSTLPYAFRRGSSVVFDNNIYIFGSYVSSNYKDFYSYSSETSKWSKVGITDSIPMQLVAFNHDDLPDGVGKWEATGASRFGAAACVSYNGKIHGFYYSYHQTFDGTEWITETDGMPYNFNSSSAVVYNNEIHVLGGSSSDDQVKHYKFDGSTWTSASTLPYSLASGCAVVYNNEIHILSGSNGPTKHYKWNGTSWTEVSTLKYDANYGKAIVYENKIHVMGGSSSGSGTMHYTWDGTEWTKLNVLPHDFTYGSPVIYNNELHYLGGLGDKRAHYKWNGTEWVSDVRLSADVYGSVAFELDGKLYVHDAVGYKWLNMPRTEWQSLGTLPYDFYQGSAVIYNDEIHILGSGSSSYRTKHYKWDGSTWTSVSTLPYTFFKGSAVILNNEIHIIGGSSSGTTKHYKWDGSTWTSVSTLPYNFNQGPAVVYNNEIHILGSYSNDARQYHYKWNGTEWTSVSTLPYTFYQGSAVVLNNEIHIIGGSGGNTNHYKWNGSTWTSVSTLPYGFSQGAAVVYNDEIHIIGSYLSSARQYHYKWDGTSWTSVSTLGYGFYDSCAVVYNNRIIILGSYVSGYYKSFYVATTIRPKATLTFIAKNLLSEAREMKLYNDNWSGWSGSDLRTWLNGDFLNSLPSELQTAITPVFKKSDYGSNNDTYTLVNTTDKVWIPSYTEIFSELKNSNARPNQGEIYSCFTDNNSRIRTLIDNTAKDWWLRSIVGGNSMYFWIVRGKNGEASYENMTKETSTYILIGFCI